MYILDCIERSVDEIEIVYGKAPEHYGISRFTSQQPKYFICESDNLTINDLYIEVTSTSTSGTIGRVIDMEFSKSARKDKDGNSIDAINVYGTTLIYEVDGRSKPSRIGLLYVKILENHDGKTKWVRNVKSRKTEIKNPINKFKQELKENDWIIGVGRGYKSQKPLMIGRVSRWTNKNVWAKTIDGQEFQLNSIKETFLLPANDEHVEILTMAVVKGWDGK